MEPNDLPPEDRDVLARALRDPVIRAALDLLAHLLAPMTMDAQTTLRLVRRLERVAERRRREQRLLGELREGLSRPGVLDRLRARRDEPIARDLLLIAYRLGLGGDSSPPGSSPAPGPARLS